MCKQLETIKVNEIQVKEYKGNRVVTFKDIDAVHGRVEGTASRNFLENKSKLIEGEDYYILSKKQNNEIRGLEIPNRGLTVVTETGYLMLVKSLTDELAWQVQRDLVKTYFRVKEVMQQPKKELSALDQLRLQYQVLEQHEEKLAVVENKIEHLENTMTLDYEQQLIISNTAKSKALDIVGGKGSLAYKELYKRVIASLWRDYKGYLKVNSYKNTARVDFEKAINCINQWNVQGELAAEVETLVNQISYFEKEEN